MEKRYFAQTQIQHDGQKFAIGDTVPVDGEQAQQLLDSGAISANRHEVEDDDVGGAATAEELAKAAAAQAKASKSAK